MAKIVPPSTNSQLPLDVRIVNAVPVLDRPIIKLTFWQKLANTCLAGLFYALLSELKIVGVVLLQQPVSRFSLLMNSAASAISVGKVNVMWLGLFVQLLLKNKVVDLGNLGTRKVEVVTNKLKHLLGVCIILVSTFARIREIRANPLKWYILPFTRSPYNDLIVLSFVAVQYVVGGIMYMLFDHLINIYALSSARPVLLVDASRSFYTWCINYNEVELNTGFSPVFTLVYTFFITALIISLFTKMYTFELEYATVKAQRYKHELKLMYGESQALMMVSIIKDTLRHIITTFESLLQINLKTHIKPLVVFLDTTDPYYSLYLNSKYWLILADIAYNLVIFSVVTVCWTMLTGIGGPNELIESFYNARLKPVGVQGSLTGLQNYLQKPLYLVLLTGTILLVSLVTLGGVFPLIGPSNVGSYITYVAIVLDLVDQIYKEHSK